MSFMTPSQQRSLCEFKGLVSCWSVRVDDGVSQDAAWGYPKSAPGYEVLKDHLCFYPSRVSACYVDDERVQPQEGDFYGGWITSDVEGPFKGGPGTIGW